MQEAGDTRRIGEILIQLGLITEQDIAEALADKKQPEATEAAIRVDVNLLEKQMNLVSELVLLRNRLLQIATETNERNLNGAVHGLNYVTSELRKNVMKTRMQPVSQLFDKLPRIVRDVSKDLGKKIKLETQGGDTELDKTLLEAIKDPVTHILRNSMDHGLESPEIRLQKGKPEEGALRIRAFHEGGNFHLEIADDGAGIDLERVKQKAISKGALTAAQVEKLSEAEALNLIFLPGLSTAEKVTNVSGRGVGMDVVKTNVERIGGLTKLQTARGRGTTVWLEIPLTLATIPALTVLSGKSVFAIPQAALVEMIAVDAEDAHKFIENIDGVSVFRFRGTVLPLMSLCQELKLPDTALDSNISKIVVVRTEGRQIALLVDAIRNTEEIVIKPLDKRFKSIALFSGAAVLGDGRVALILDIAALARRAGVVTARGIGAQELTDAQPKERLTLLLLGGSDGERMAVPLDFVQRLEEFPASAKELMGGLDVVQYRGEILRVVRLQELLENRRAHARNPQLAGAGRLQRKNFRDRRALGNFQQLYLCKSIRFSESPRSKSISSLRPAAPASAAPSSCRSASPNFSICPRCSRKCTTRTLTSPCSWNPEWKPPMSAKQRYSTFFLNGICFGVHVEKVQEVMEFQNITPDSRSLLPCSLASSISAARSSLPLISKLASISFRCRIFRPVHDDGGPDQRRPHEPAGR